LIDSLEKMQGSQRWELLKKSIFLAFNKQPIGYNHYSSLVFLEKIASDPTLERFFPDREPQPSHRLGTLPSTLILSTVLSIEQPTGGGSLACLITAEAASKKISTFRYLRP
jgi:hypothetical protein